VFEFGITADYLETFGIDASRVLHIPVDSVETLKFDMVKKLDEIKRGDRVFFMIDSLGQLSSKKEIDDTKDEKSTVDMTRDKGLRSFLRMVTTRFTTLDIPCVAISHTYKTLEMFSKTVIPGGTSVTYSANQIFIITKAQEKVGTELEGWKFTINIEKSRFVREKSKFPFTVMYDSGILPYSGLIDIASESGHVAKPKNGWFTRPGIDVDKNYRKKDTDNKEFWDPILLDESFNDWIKDRYKMSASLVTEEMGDEDE